MGLHFDSLPPGRLPFLPGVSRPFLVQVGGWLMGRSPSLVWRAVQSPVMGLTLSWHHGSASNCKSRLWVGGCLRPSCLKKHQQQSSQTQAVSPCAWST